MFLKLLKRLAPELEKAGIPYMVIGGQAVLLYGEPRLTRDIDVTLGVGIDGIAQVRKVAATMDLAILKDDDGFIKRTMVMPVRENSSGIRVDLIFSFSAYERHAIERAKAVDIDGTMVKFASLEDVMIHKMIAGRPRDIEDVKSMLVKNPKYDRSYVLSWLKEFDSSLSGGYVEAFDKLVKDIE